MLILAVVAIFLLAIAGHYAYKADTLKKSRARLRETWYNPKPSHEELRYKKLGKILTVAAVASFLLLVLFAIGGLPLALFACMFLVCMHIALAAA